MKDSHAFSYPIAAAPRFRGRFCSIVPLESVA